MYSNLNDFYIIIFILLIIHIDSILGYLQYLTIISQTSEPFFEDLYF